MKTWQRYSHEAMATQFQIVFADPDYPADQAQSIAQRVFAEISRLEEELSRFKSTSDVWRINGLRAGETVHVDFATLDCLLLAKAVHAETSAAFDPTVGSLMTIWRNADGMPRQPSEPELASARARCGLHLLDIDEAEMTVTARADYVQLDFGAVGKGYALDQCVRLLEEHQITGALINAGDSTLLAYGAAATNEGWPVRLYLESPQSYLLKDAALSCSGFEVKGHHIIDPRTGQPTPIRDQRVYVEAPTAALSDALSTAFMLMTEPEIANLCARLPGVTYIK
jgi:FAD:protein FMN transferase